MTTPKQNKDALGKGIRSLLQSIDSDLKNTAGQLQPQAVEQATGTLRLPIENIETNPKQPRRDFDEQSLQELANSIKMHDIIVNDGEKINPYQFYVTGSYDYLKNNKFITGIAFTRFFTKDSLPFYTSPLQNEIYTYFTYKKLWFKPSVAFSYGWGSRSEFDQREEYIQTLRLLINGFTRVNTKESINDLNLIASVRHDFYWLDVLGKKDYIRLTPQFVFISGTQKFGFNQSSSTYATVPRTGANILFASDNFYLDDELYYQPLSLSTYIKAEYSKGKFFIQPQLIFDYYFPAAEKNFTTAFVMNAGVIF